MYALSTGTIAGCCRSDSVVVKKASGMTVVIYIVCGCLLLMCCCISARPQIVAASVPTAQLIPEKCCVCDVLPTILLGTIHRSRARGSTGSGIVVAYYCATEVLESLPSVPDVYGQSLEVLLTQPAASERESYVPDAVSE
ncbi:hypothetical protein Tco_1202337 [Tanacetum coccineum]